MANFDKDTDQEFTLDVTHLREQGRPMWMSPLGIDHPADMVGGGGDVWTDRLTPEWPRHYGQELTGEESHEQGESSQQKGFSGHEGFPPKSESAQTVEDAFRYVHSETEQESSS